MTGGLPSARTAPGAAALVAVLGLALLIALVVALGLSGATVPLVLGDPGPAVRWGLPLASGVSRLAAAICLGALSLCAFALPPGRDWDRARDLATLAASAWAFLQGVELILSLASMTGGLTAETAVPQLTEFLSTGAGQSLAAATLGAAAAAVAAVLTRGPGGAVVGLLLSGAAVLGLAQSGHAAGAVGHGTAVSALWLHVGAAALWIGGLATLLLVVRAQLGVAASRYSVLAGWCYAVLAFSGVVGALVRLTGPADLLGTSWGLMIVVKAAVLVALGLVGARHRLHTLPLLAAGRAGSFVRLAVGELALMAAVVGLSVALASAPAPRPAEVAAPDAVVQLTGYAAPPPPTVVTYLTELRVEPVTLVFAASAGITYLRWVRRLRRRGDAWPRRRTVSAVVGLLGFAVVTSGGPAVYGSVQFSAAMAQHLALVTVLPVAMALANPLSLALRALPARQDGSCGPREWLLAVLHHPVAVFLARPVVASVHVVLSMAVLYLTPLHGLVLSSHLAHLLMVVHLSVAGYLFANAVVGSDPGPRRPPHAARLALLLPSMVFHTFFGLALLSSSTLLAPEYYARLALPWLDDPLADQRVGGALTWAMGELPVLGLALLIAGRWALADERDQRARQRRRSTRQELSARRADPRSDRERVGVHDQLAQAKEVC